jgi:DNA-binding transcriptional ArsR family regulator
MATGRSEILLHQVRLRIVLSASGDEVTTADLAQRLPDIPAASLYRHIAKLHDAGILEVVDERQARGAVEKTYRVNAEAAHLDAAAAASMTKDEHLEAFTMFAGTLIESYGRYLAKPDAVPHEDGVGFRQIALNLTDTEFDTMVKELAEVVERHTGLDPRPDRSRRLLTTIIIPDRQ